MSDIGTVRVEVHLTADEAARLEQVPGATRAGKVRTAIRLLSRAAEADREGLSLALCRGDEKVCELIVVG